MSIYAVIPARGGSKGIEDKNLREVGGKSLIRLSVEMALAASCIDRVFVSTDCEKIAAAAVQAGAVVIDRPVELSGDQASSETALLHAIEWWKENEFGEPQNIVFLQCTSPLTLPEDIDGTFQAMADANADSALSVAPFHYFVWHNTPDGAVGVNHDKQKRQLRQDREPEFLESGAVYVMNTRGFVQAGHRFFGKTAMYEMPHERVLEIDDPVDLKLAECVLAISKTDKS